MPQGTQDRLSGGEQGIVSPEALLDAPLYVSLMIDPIGRPQE